MKVKVGNQIHDGSLEPIMVIFTEQDKENIKNMASWATKYCEYPVEKFDRKAIEEWMKDDNALFDPYEIKIKE